MGIFTHPTDPRTTARVVKIRQHSGNLSVYRADDPAWDTPDKIKCYGTLCATRFAWPDETDCPCCGADMEPCEGEWWNLYLTPHERSSQREVQAYEALPTLGEDQPVYDDMLHCFSCWQDSIVKPAVGFHDEGGRMGVLGACVEHRAAHEAAAVTNGYSVNYTTTHPNT